MYALWMTKGIDFPGIAVTVFCHDGFGNYLVGKRSTKCRDEHGRWNPVGGGLKHGERLEDAIRRELREEICAEPKEFEQLGFREVHRELNGQPTHWIIFDFKALVDPAAVAIGEPDMMDELKWVKINEIPAPMSSQFPLFLEKYKHAW
jgi:ADP-ribose pyrophosphatase YjhB (NUDIX family)